MAYSMIFGVLIILLETNIISGTCTEQFFDYGKQNVVLEFNFGWIISETRHVLCFYGSNKIGECYDSFGYICALDPASSGVYGMSTNADLTGVNITIMTFISTTSGNYSCSKNTFTQNFTKCVQNSVSTTTDCTTLKPEDWTELCISGFAIGSFAGIIWVFDFVYVIILFKRDGCRLLCQHGKPACYRNKGCLTTMLVFVIAGMGMVGFGTRCEEGWSDTNRAAIALVVLGVVILAAMFISTIKAHLVDLDLLKDLHYGLVLSDLSHFMTYAIKDIEQHLPSKCMEYKQTKKLLIDKFLLVISETCELVLPKTCEKRISTLKSSDSKSELKQFYLEVEEHNCFPMNNAGNKGDYKVNIYKIRKDDEEYYICAYVPKALTVISQLSHKLPGKINVILEKQRIQQLYQQILYAKGWTHIVKLCQCKGNADVARALFDAAKILSTDNKECNTESSQESVQKAIHSADGEGADTIVLHVASPKENASQATGKRKDWPIRFSRLTNQVSIGSPVGNAHAAEKMINDKIRKTPTAGDVIPGLAWDYVLNYLMPILNHGRNNFHYIIETYIDQNSINCGCIQKLMIVWKKSCDTDRVLAEVANVGDTNRQVNPLKDISILSEEICSPFKLNVYKFKNDRTRLERCFLAAYCTHMKCIQTIEKDFKEFSSSALLDQGRRFKNVFDEIMSMKIMQDIFREFKVSMIYFDDGFGVDSRWFPNARVFAGAVGVCLDQSIKPKGRLIDLLERTILRSKPVIYSTDNAQ